MVFAGERPLSQTHQDRALRSLCDLDNGLISREIYVNEDIYHQELEQVFRRAWLLIGHESQVPNPGDFVISRMGEEEVILTRDRKNQLHVFLNTCRHRGMKVCRYDDGNTLIFTCPYHGWSYDTDGRLVGVAYYDVAYQGNLDKNEWGLHEVAQMCNYYGSIWATWDAKAPSFEDYLGPYARTVQACMEASDGTEAGIEVFNPVYKWRIPCNWKLPAVMFDGDRAHAAMTHRSINVAAISPAGEINGGGRHVVKAPWPQEDYEISSAELGHCGHNAIFEQPGIAPYTDTWLTEPPEVDEYFRQARDKKAKKYEGVYGHEAGIEWTVKVWPNANIQPQRWLFWHPHAPGITESWRLYPVDKEAPKIVKDAVRHYMMRYGGPCGLTESDDMENWNYAHAASSGTEAKTLPYHFAMGLGRAHTDSRLPGMTLNFEVAEENQRNSFRRWLAFMEADSWDDLYPVLQPDADGNGIHG